MPALFRRVVICSVLLALTACGGLPLDSIGLRSSEWINEPTVATTIPVVTTTPTVVSSLSLSWVNDSIKTQNLADPGDVLSEVFARRQGDRFVQASRLEIATALPRLVFPEEAPSGAEWVSSQLVFENDGTLSDDPSAAFGIWSAEPYSRSRSVAQMVVIRVARDEKTAEEVANQTEPSCARFSDRDTDDCEIIDVGERNVWVLVGAGGSTLIWFDGPYRYELFGRSFVPLAVLEDMSANTVPLSSLGAQSS